MPDWDERYRRGEHVELLPMPFIVELEPLIAEECGGRGRALDLASGPGRHALFLAECGWKVSAIDRSTVALDLLSDAAKARAVTVETLAADLEAPAFRLPPESCDLVLDCCFLYWPLFDEVETALRPGGVLIAAIPMRDDDPDVKPMNEAYLVDRGEIRSRFPDWRVLHERDYKRGRANRKLCELVLQRPSR